jgi:uncharacterized LabA/DUF88 family protein
MLDDGDLPGGQDSPDKGQAPEMARAPFLLRAKPPYIASFHIDGFNLYHAIDALNDNRLKWLDLLSLANSYLRPDDQLGRVVFFTAINTWDSNKRRRHVEYLRALLASDVQVIESAFSTNRDWCHTYERYCKFKVEKQTDVAIAVEVLGDCYADLVDRIFLLSADSDQVPLIRHIDERFPEKRVFVIAPPERLSQARELGAKARAVFELTRGRLFDHLFPQNVEDSFGKIAARRPTPYAR